MKKTYIIDIDGVVCKTKDGDYKKAKPFKTRINKINKLYKEGNTIIFHTSRGKLSGIDWSSITSHQFKRWKLKHHDIIFGKPYGDYYVDDKAINDKEFFKLK
jgi:hypothetical protein